MLDRFYATLFNRKQSNAMFLSISGLLALFVAIVWFCLFFRFEQVNTFTSEVTSKPNFSFYAESDGFVLFDEKMVSGQIKRNEPMYFIEDDFNQSPVVLAPQDGFVIGSLSDAFTYRRCSKGEFLFSLVSKKEFLVKVTLPPRKVSQITAGQLARVRNAKTLEYVSSNISEIHRHVEHGNIVLTAIIPVSSKDFLLGEEVDVKIIGPRLSLVSMLVMN
ncbi:HlyD family efflux transporter periplasmic adaptor subunit [Vibrio bivalvicida]|uniref:HlyD family efflux transporter periplasmic adaptor subunit n=1 Tax=Vibrio bivalvicida TaxID=1276888 RepID=A0ABV4MIM4_9VIBR